MSALALHYALKPVQYVLDVPFGAVQHATMTQRVRARFMNAVVAVSCGRDEELELLGEPVAGLRAPERARLRPRIGVLSPAADLISTLNAWENIALPAGYHGAPPLERVARTAREVLKAFGADPRPLLAKLPHELSSVERQMVAATRLLASEPEIAIVEMQGTHERRIESEYRSRQPSGALLFIESSGEEA